MILDKFKQLKRNKLNIQLELFDKMYSRGTKEEPKSFPENLDLYEWQIEFEIFLEVLREKRVKHNV